MPYSLWSRGQLIAHTDDEFEFRGEAKCGFLYPTESGAAIVELAASSTRWMDDPTNTRSPAAARAAMNDAEQRFVALELELRGPDGALVQTELIGVNDCDRLSALAEKALEEHDAWYEQISDAERASFDEAVEHDRALIEEWFSEDDEPEWRPEPAELPRFQLVVA